MKGRCIMLDYANFCPEPHRQGNEHDARHDGRVTLALMRAACARHLEPGGIAPESPAGP